MATIKHKRGTRAALDTSPGLQQGELGLCTDTGEVFIGNNGNHPILEQVAAKTLMGNTGSDKALPSAIPAADILEMIGGQAVIQYEVMPTTVTEGAVVQYVGEDTAEYVSGSWYRGENGEWTLVSGSGGVYVGVGEMPDGYNVQIDPSGEVYDPMITTNTATNITGILSGNGTNMVGLTPAEALANIGAAPAGYGLGGDSLYTDDCNAVTKNGWYYGGANTKNSPTTYFCMMYFHRVTGEGIQIAFSVAYAEIFVRRKINGTWMEWGSVNPLMVVGGEYRTTEYHNGKPVYTKIIDFGLLPNSNVKNYYLGVGLTLLSNMGYADNSTYHIPLSTLVGAEFYYNPTSGNFGVTTTKDLSSYTAYIVLRYTKD